MDVCVIQEQVVAVTRERYQSSKKVERVANSEDSLCCAVLIDFCLGMSLAHMADLTEIDVANKDCLQSPEQHSPSMFGFDIDVERCLPALDYRLNDFDTHQRLHPWWIRRSLFHQVSFGALCSTTMEKMKDPTIWSCSDSTILIKRLIFSLVRFLLNFTSTSENLKLQNLFEYILISLRSFHFLLYSP